MLSKLEEIFPENNPLDAYFWTPNNIITKAINWLVSSSDTKILDIGSGSGKFCLSGALQTKAHFTGVEKRKTLITEANNAVTNLSIKNVSFIHSNITEIDFSNYNAFYFYNPFGEHLPSSEYINNEIVFSENKFYLYQEYVFKQLSKLKRGARLVTYFSPYFFPPESFIIKDILDDGNLVFWEKH
jgi:16S rRNA A1518/A1519 N6-dimethyltransferase RsmA/KsgA/DIM1 with predicted DNA glycosylase/AP lyase activity